MKMNGCKTWSALGASAILLAAGFLPASQAQEKKDKVKPAGGIIGKILEKRKKADMITAMNNSKKLFFLMVEFDQDFGSFPNDDTANDDDDLKNYKGKHSNDYLGQFIAGGYTLSEEIFHAKGGSNTVKKPDNDISTKAKTLEAGECGFAYVKGLSTSDHSGKPLLLAPMTGKGFKFDPEPYNGKAIVLRIDGSVKIYQIDANGDVVLPNGKKLFEGGKDTVWGEKGLDAKSLLFPK